MPPRCDLLEQSVAAQAVACTSAPGWVTVEVDRLDSAPRFWIRACRKACSEAVALPLAAPVVPDVVEVDAALPLEVPVVAGVVEVEAAPPFEVPVVAVVVEPLPEVVPAAAAPTVVDVELVAPGAGGVSALTSA
jgi:hypothetical protein